MSSNVDQITVQPRSQGLSPLSPLSLGTLFPTTREAEERDPGNEVDGQAARTSFRPKLCRPKCRVTSPDSLLSPKSVRQANKSAMHLAVAIPGGGDAGQNKVRRTVKCVNK